MSFLSFSDSIDNLYAFQFAAVDGWSKSFGWNMFDIQSEYLRMGAPSEHWTLTQLNKSYEVSTIKLIFVDFIV